MSRRAAASLLAITACAVALLTGCADERSDVSEQGPTPARAAVVPLDEATSSSVLTTWCAIQTTATEAARATAMLAVAGVLAVQVLSADDSAAQLQAAAPCGSPPVLELIEALADPTLTHLDVAMLMAQIRAPLRDGLPPTEDALRRLQDVAERYPGARVRRERDRLLFELASAWPAYDRDGEILDDARLQALLAEVGTLLGTAVGAGTGTVEVTTL